MIYHGGTRLLLQTPTVIGRNLLTIVEAEGVFDLVSLMVVAEKTLALLERVICSFVDTLEAFEVLIWVVVDLASVVLVC